jgi:hypothetical protein
MESVSRFEAATPAGTFTLDQHLVFALDRESPAVADSSLIVSLPVEGGANAFRSDTATVSMEGDFGAPVFVHVQADVTQVSFHGPDTGATSARLDVQTAYAADWVTVTAQHVTVTLPGELATSSVATGHNESAANNPYAAWRAIDANGILSRTSLDFTERRRT